MSAVGTNPSPEQIITALTNFQTTVKSRYQSFSSWTTAGGLSANKKVIDAVNLLYGDIDLLMNQTQGVIQENFKQPIDQLAAQLNLVDEDSNEGKVPSHANILKVAAAVDAIGKLSLANKATGLPTVPQKQVLPQSVQNHYAAQPTHSGTGLVLTTSSNLPPGITPELHQALKLQHQQQQSAILTRAKKEYLQKQQQQAAHAAAASQVVMPAYFVPNVIGPFSPKKMPQVIASTSFPQFNSAAAPQLNLFKVLPELSQPQVINGQAGSETAAAMAAPSTPLSLTHPNVVKWFREGIIAIVKGEFGIPLQQMFKTTKPSQLPLKFILRTFIMAWVVKDTKRQYVPETFVRMINGKPTPAPSLITLCQPQLISQLTPEMLGALVINDPNIKDDLAKYFAELEFIVTRIDITLKAITELRGIACQGHSMISQIEQHAKMNEANMKSAFMGQAFQQSQQHQKNAVEAMSKYGSFAAATAAQAAVAPPSAPVRLEPQQKYLQSTSSMFSLSMPFGEPAPKSGTSKPNGILPFAPIAFVRQSTTGSAAQPSSTLTMASAGLRLDTGYDEVCESIGLPTLQRQETMPLSAYDNFEEDL